MRGFCCTRGGGSFDWQRNACSIKSNAWFPSRGRYFAVLSPPDRLWDPPIRWVQRVKLSEHAADSLPSRSEVKNFWTQIYAFMARYLIKYMGQINLCRLTFALCASLARLRCCDRFFGRGCGCQNLGLLHELTRPIYWTYLNTLTGHS
jgi:hypothetical protein